MARYRRQRSEESDNGGSGLGALIALGAGVWLIGRAFTGNPDVRPVPLPEPEPAPPPAAPPVSLMRTSLGIAPGTTVAAPNQARAIVQNFTGG